MLASRVVRGTLDRYNVITGNVYINGQRYTVTLSTYSIHRCDMSKPEVDEHVTPRFYMFSYPFFTAAGTRRG